MPSNIIGASNVSSLLLLFLLLGWSNQGGCDGQECSIGHFLEKSESMRLFGWDNISNIEMDCIQYSHGKHITLKHDLKSQTSFKHPGHHQGYV
jgi:hypothetical protein